MCPATHSAGFNANHACKTDTLRNVSESIFPRAFIQLTVKLFASLSMQMRVRFLFPEPKDCARLGFFHRNESAFASRCLKFLESFHGASSIGAFPRGLRPVRHECS